MHNLRNTALCSKGFKASLTLVCIFYRVTKNLSHPTPHIFAFYIFGINKMHHTVVNVQPCVVAGYRNLLTLIGHYIKGTVKTSECLKRGLTPTHVRKLILLHGIIAVTNSYRWHKMIYCIHFLICFCKKENDWLPKKNHPFFRRPCG